MTIQEINEKYIELYNDLYLARAVLPDVQYNSMHKALHKQYSEDIKICLDNIKLETGRSNFELKYKLKKYLPRGTFIFANRVARGLLKKFKQEFLLELKALNLERVDLAKEGKIAGFVLKDQKDELKQLTADIHPEECEEQNQLVPADTKDVEL